MNFESIIEVGNFVDKPLVPPVRVVFLLLESLNMLLKLFLISVFEIVGKLPKTSMLSITFGKLFFFFDTLYKN